MSFDSEKFGTLGGQQDGGIIYQLFSYRSVSDSQATVLTTGYFNNIRETLKVDDIIKVFDESADIVYEIKVATSPSAANGADVTVTLSGGAGSGSSVREITVSDTILISDKIILASNTITLTLPLLASIDDPEFILNNIGTGTVTIDGDGAEEIKDFGASMTISAGEGVTLTKSVALGQWVVIGNI